MKYLVIVSSCLLIASYIAFQSGFFKQSDEGEIVAEGTPLVAHDTLPLRPESMEPEPEPVVFPSSKVIIMTETPLDPRDVIFESLLKPGAIFGPDTN